MGKRDSQKTAAAAMLEIDRTAFYEVEDQWRRAPNRKIGESKFGEAKKTMCLSVHIEGVPVKVFGVAKTVADCFRHRRSVGQAIVLEGLQEALRQNKGISNAGGAGHACNKSVSELRCSPVIRIPVTKLFEISARSAQGPERRGLRAETGELLVG